MVRDGGGGRSMRADWRGAQPLVPLAGDVAGSAGVIWPGATGRGGCPPGVGGTGRWRVLLYGNGAARCSGGWLSRPGWVGAGSVGRGGPDGAGRGGRSPGTGDNGRIRVLAVGSGNAVWGDRPLAAAGNGRVRGSMAGVSNVDRGVRSLGVTGGSGRPRMLAAGGGGAAGESVPDPAVAGGDISLRVPVAAAGIAGRSGRSLGTGGNS